MSYSAATHLAATIGSCKRYLRGATRGRSVGISSAVTPVKYTKASKSASSSKGRVASDAGLPGIHKPPTQCIGCGRRSHAGTTVELSRQPQAKNASPSAALAATLSIDSTGFLGSALTSSLSSTSLGLCAVNDPSPNV